MYKAELAALQLEEASASTLIALKVRGYLEGHIASLDLGFIFSESARRMLEISLTGLYH